MIPTHRKPTTPGEMLKHEFLAPSKIKLEDLAADIAVSKDELRKLIKNETKMTKSFAKKLADYFSMSWEFWTSLQDDVDAWERREVRRRVDATATHPLFSTGGHRFAASAKFKKAPGVRK